MTDALHTCARCGVADHNVSGPSRPGHLQPQGLHPYEEHCIAALQRELAAANALLDRCVPIVTKLAELGRCQVSTDQARALLADIRAKAWE